MRELVAEGQRRSEEDSERARRRERAERLERAASFWNQSKVPALHREWADDLVAGRFKLADDAWHDAYRHIRDRVDRVTQGGRVAFNRRTSLLVALLGDRGCGKTQLAVAVLRAACSSLVPCRYVVAADLFRELRCSFRDGGPSELEVLAPYRSAGVLVIDELHERAHSDFERREFVNLIDHRYRECRPTLLISNEQVSAFEEAVGPSVASRINEVGEAIICEGWPNFREGKKG